MARYTHYEILSHIVSAFELFALGIPAREHGRDQDLDIILDQRSL